MTLTIYRLMAMGLGTVVLGYSLLTASGWTIALNSIPPLLAQTFPQEQKAQMLPITAQAQIGTDLIQLEVAQTPRQQAVGLMFRTSLASDRAMLFPFNPPRVVGFWMKNCKMSLDLIFLRNGVVQAILAEAPPCTAEPCPSYGPKVPVDQVIELRGGRAQELGVQVGDRIQVQAVPR